MVISDLRRLFLLGLLLLPWPVGAVLYPGNVATMTAIPTPAEGTEAIDTSTGQRYDYSQKMGYKWIPYQMGTFNTPTNTLTITNTPTSTVTGTPTPTSTPTATNVVLSNTIYSGTNMSFGLGSNNINGPGASENLWIGDGNGGSNSVTNFAYSVVVGQTSAYSVTTGGGDVLIGAGVAKTAKSLTYSNLMGIDVGQAMTSSSYDTVDGALAFAAATTTDDDSAFGAYALNGCTSCTDNVAVGTSAGKFVTTGQYNVYVGKSAGENAQGNYQTNLGAYEGQNETTNWAVHIGSYGHDLFTGNINTGTVTIGTYVGAGSVVAAKYNVQINPTPGATPTVVMCSPMTVLNTALTPIVIYVAH
jgi:hypothetical protein